VTYFLAEDGWGEPTIWRENGDFPIAVLTEFDIPQGGREIWPLIVKALTTTEENEQ
jgi:hypothetical protein